MKRHNLIIRTLLRIGIVRINWRDDSIRWPVSIAPRWLWNTAARHPIKLGNTSGYVYLFRNRPGVIKWDKDMLLPRRWGFGIMGLIEFGQRG